MVKSKRTNKDKVQKTSKVDKKPKAQKETFLNTVKTLLAQYSTFYALKINNMRTNIIKRIREDFSDSKIVFGKKRILNLALGESSMTECIKETDALLLTERSYDDIKETLSKYKTLEFARTGSTCNQTVMVPAQSLNAFGVDLHPTLRDLGMNVEIKDGVIILMEDFQICEKGEQLTNTMCRLLKFFNVQIAQFSVDVIAMAKGEELRKFDENSAEITTNIANSVRIMCEQLDDGKYYFIPHDIEGEDMDM